MDYELEAVFKSWVEKAEREWHVFDHASVVTAKPAIGGHFKTGHRDWAKTTLFYLSEAVLGKLRA